MHICKGCKYYEPYFCIVKGKQFNRSFCCYKNKKVTLRKTNCDYKQLQAKTDECKELGDKYNKLNEANKNMEIYIGKLHLELDYKNNRPSYWQNPIIVAKDILELENTALKQQLDMSVEALEFYAKDENRWNCENYNECITDGDCGSIAKTALDRIKPHKPQAI